MEVKFEKQVLSCMDLCLREDRSSEETLELRIPEGMPDAGKILAAWGQPLLRSKEWRSDRIVCTAGMMVWVLYRPESGGDPQCLDGWVSHTLRWDLPRDCPEGDLRIDLATRFVDARIASARKIMVRAGIGAEAQAWIPSDVELYTPGKIPEELQLRREKYPLRLIREVGEKAFTVDQTLDLPSSAPSPVKIVRYALSPSVSEKKLVANKLIFRGNGDLDMMYLAEDGQLHTWGAPVSFSQYAELDGSYGHSAEGDVIPTVTALEPELEENGKIRIKCAMTGQYIVSEQQTAETVTDAYIPGREVRIRTQALSVPVLLDTWQESVDIRQELSGSADIPVGAWTTGERPRQRPLEDGLRLEFPGHLQALYQASDGSFSSASGRYEGSLFLKTDPDCTVLIRQLPVPEPQVTLGADSMDVRFQIPVRLTAYGKEAMEPVMAVEIGEAREPDPGRPSLILRRVGEDGLWETAKSAGSTVDAIQKANGLQEEPAPGKLLLIPVT